MVGRVLRDFLPNAITIKQDYGEGSLQEATQNVMDALRRFFREGSITGEELAMGLAQWEHNVEEAKGVIMQQHLWEEWW